MSVTSTHLRQLVQTSAPDAKVKFDQDQKRLPRKPALMVAACSAAQTLPRRTRPTFRP
jgi:hypothetical protein